MKKEEVVRILQEKMKKRQVIVAAGVDTPEEEKWCSEAGCPLVLFYPTAEYQNAKNPFLAGFFAFGNANTMMEDAARQWMSVLTDNGLLAAVNCSDPFKNDNLLLGYVKNTGFAGIHNYPPMSLVDGQFGVNLEKLKEGTEKEIQMIRKAAKENLLTCCMVSGRKPAVQFARAGADVLIICPGLGEKLTDSRETVSFYTKKLRETVSAVRKISVDIPLLFTGEQIASVEDVVNIIKETGGINGYFLPLVMRPKAPENQIKMEIEKLKEICY